MPNKMKRSRRRQDEARVKDKFRRVVKEFVGDVNSWTNRWMWEWVDGKAKHIHIIDRTGAVRRMRTIEKQAVQMAHHPAHQCQMCREDPKSHKRRMEREVKKKAPMDVED